MSLNFLIGYYTGQSYARQSFHSIVAAIQFDKSDKISDNHDRIYVYQVITKRSVHSDRIAGGEQTIDQAGTG